MQVPNDADSRRKSDEPLLYRLRPGRNAESLGHKCDAAGTARFIGQPGTGATGAAIKRTTKAAVLRWAPPGVMLTMDFREDRVTVYLGPDKRVTKINCG